jgi:hypothetical protein
MLRLLLLLKILYWLIKILAEFVFGLKEIVDAILSHEPDDPDPEDIRQIKR